MLPIDFHPDIALEIKSSYQWYQNQVYGLGDDFLTELENPFQRFKICQIHGHFSILIIADFY